MIIFYKLLLTIISLLLRINSETISSENEFRNIISNDMKILEIYVKNKINFKDNVNIIKSFEKISITGSSIGNSILNFNDLSHGFYINENVEEIELINVSIIGNIYFNNVKKITIKGVSFQGNIETNFEKIDNEYIKISNFLYNPSKITNYNCINLEGNVEIENSDFYGSSSCQNRLLSFNGSNKYKLSIKYSHFSGEYSCPCVQIYNCTNSNIENSTIENAYVPLGVNGGAGIKMSYSHGKILNSTLKNNLSSSNGGSFDLYNIYNFYANNLNIFNTTALNLGSMAYINSDYNVNSIIKFENIQQINSGNMNGMKSGGMIMAIEENGAAEIENYYAENLINHYSSGAAFILTNIASLTVRNLEINKLKGKAVEGLLLNTFNSKGVTFNAYNFTLNDFHQESVTTSAALLWLEENTNVYIEDGRMLNFQGYNTHLIYISNYCDVNINGLEIDNFFSKTPKEFIHMNINESKSTFINFNKLKINNINSQGILFRLVLGKFSLKNSEIRNIHRCNINNSCTNLGGSDIMTNTELFIIGSKCEVTIENTIFDNIYGGNGIMISADTTMNLENNTFSNSYFKNGLIMIDNERPEIVISGKYLINNCNFNNIKSEFGSVLHIKSLFESSNTLMEFRNSIFENNTASKYGGVIYSNSEFTNKYIRMYDCTFINNHAQIGHTLYSLNKESEPYISNINELRAIQGSVMTNPTKLILNDNNIKTISLISSDVLPSGISCSIYDDYNNLISFNSDISSIDFDEFMFFGIVSNDTYNVELKGQTQSYCWGDSCTFPSVKIIGNPGSYKIRLIINTFGRFNKFKNSYIDIPIEIKTCNNSYIYQFKESKRLKSCYEPKCELGCNTGECVNINVCNCQNTKFTGKNCDEYFKLERIKILDLIIQIICVILIITIIIILILTILYKNDPIIKGGSIDFLIIILFGLIINIIYTIMLTFERTTTKCYLIYLLNNIGFSLVFGSILVKALRIYKIFHTTRKRNRGIKKSTMYIVVISIVSYHLLISLKWILKEDIKSTLSITSSYKEYAKCVYPTSKKICIIINFAILLIGSWLSYSIRNVKKNFRENLVVPVYVYVLFTIIIEVVNIEEDISIKIQDLFAEIGTIINTFVVLFYLYIDKLYSVYIAIEIENEKTRKSSRSQFGNSSQNLYSNFGSNVYLYSNNGSVPNFKSSSNLITM